MARGRHTGRPVFSAFADLRYVGHDPETARLLLDVVERLPASVKAFALRRCAFLSLGQGRTAGWQGTARLIVLRDDLTPADAHAQVTVAHELAHAWLAHHGQADGERQVAALVRQWGFTGEGADLVNVLVREDAPKNVPDDIFGYCDRAVAARNLRLRRWFDCGAPDRQERELRTALFDRFCDPDIPPTELREVMRQLAARADVCGSRPRKSTDVRGRLRRLNQVRSEIFERRRIYLGRGHYLGMRRVVDLGRHRRDAWICHRVRTLLNGDAHRPAAREDQATPSRPTPSRPTLPMPRPELVESPRRQRTARNMDERAS